MEKPDRNRQLHLFADKSFIERLMLDVPLYRRQENANPPYDVTVLTELRENYRSHPAILDQPNRQFYHGDLKYCAKQDREMFVDWPVLPKPGFPVIFHGAVGEEQREESSPSFFNTAEISITVDYVDKLLERRSQQFKTGDIGIITPYRKQVSNTSSRRLHAHVVKLRTVERIRFPASGTGHPYFKVQFHLGK